MTLESNENAESRSAGAGEGLTRRQLLLTSTELARLAAAVAAMVAASGAARGSPAAPMSCLTPGYSNYMGVGQNCEDYDCDSFACRGELLDDFECSDDFNCDKYRCENSFDFEDCENKFMCWGEYVDDDG